MVIFLYGTDSYRRKNKLRELVQNYKNKYEETDLLSIDLEDEPESWIRGRDFLGQPSLFLSSKVLIVKEAVSVEEKEWLAVLKKELETQKNFVLISDKKEPPPKFGFLLEKPSVFQHFPELEGAALDLFLKNEAARRGLDFRSEAYRRLYKFIIGRKERSWVAVNELEKLSLLKAEKPISEEDIEKTVRLEDEEDVSEAVGVILSRDSRTRLGFLEKLFLQKEETVRIFNSLAYQARGENLKRLSDYDVAVKGGKLGYEEALTDFVISNW